MHADTPGADPVKQQVLLDFPESMVRARMIRTHRWKYIHRLVGGHELYDLMEDPDELCNRIDDEACRPVLDDLRARLINRLMEAESTLPEIGALYA